MKYSLVIGRFQPFHDGHKALIQKLISEDKSVLVAVMDTEIDSNNPYTLQQREKMIRDEFGEHVAIIVVPPIAEVCYGRNVGYDVRRIRHDKEGISASKLRSSDPIGAFEDEEFLRLYKKMAERVHHLAASQGLWPKDRHVAIPISLAHSELSEALECFRMGNPPDKNISEMNGAEVQLSDVLGILMDMEVGYGLDISGALAKKMEFNKTRGYMHGGKLF
jgi:hypothetical protein